eukprot:TRINITY_DN4885_c0_g1_i4.p1 TRINITY_DN4885_c0_g1~~TRINITY_DN4885_c0_g1_i4.p1  ORF type:complete len:229 (+),score=45.77 TRINITY_DN4885_c0_g1_i4:699-1385(+)
MLSTTSAFFALLYGALVGIEKISFLKLLSIGICVAGVSMISYNDSVGKGSNTVLGDVLSLLSAVYYGLYTIYLRKSTEGKEISMPMFLGFVGILNMAIMWPGLILFHFTGVEIFELPNLPTFGYLTLNGFIGTVLSDVLWCTVVILTSPVVATMGLSLTIPLALCADFFISHKKFSFVSLIGSFFVFGGFILLNLVDVEKENRMWMRLWKKCVNLRAKKLITFPIKYN